MQAIGDAVDVIEVADDLCRVMDRRIVPANLPQAGYVGLCHICWRESKFDGVIQQGLGGFV
ncbi:uncharacterized protein METZ01_LOCUS484487 [marine metagenome]|uniref:Uncharacterized protein n=1 Tax=marine metagenome TaxID=408172 RepID=A0A383CHU6_9ZZZZ